MNRIYYIAAIALCTLLTGCSSEDEVNSGAAKKEITLSAVTPENNVQRITMSDASVGTTHSMKVNWAETDKIQVINATQLAAASFATTGQQGGGTGTAKFTGNLDAALGDHLVALYPATQSYSNDEGTISLFIKTAAQQGSLDYVQSKSLMVASTNYAAQGTNLAFKNGMAIVKVQLTMPTTANVKTLTLSSKDGTLKNAGTLQVGADGSLTWSSLTTGDVVVTFATAQTITAGGTLTAYVLLMPQTVNGLTLKVTTGAGSVYTAALTNAATLAAGKMYGISKALTAPVPGVINGHAYVDMGLSVKWATCNVGATKPEGVGTYYGWGDITGTKSFRYLSDYPSANPPLSITGNAAYDAARALWGSSWRIPTVGEIQELLDNTTYSMTTQNEVSGCLFTSKKNGKSIFLPLTGYKSSNGFFQLGTAGFYQTGDLNTTFTGNANCLSFSTSNISISFTARINGLPIRPVSE